MRVNCREQIANPAEPVNGQDERRKCAAIPRSRSIIRPQATDFAQQNRPLQKENTILTDGVSSWSGRRGSTRYRHPTNGRAIRRSPAGPLDSTRFAPVEAASSSPPAAFQKENTILTDGVSFCDCPQVLLSVNQCLLSCFSGDVVAPSSKSVTT